MTIRQNDLDLSLVVAELSCQCCCRCYVTVPPKHTTCQSKRIHEIKLIQCVHDDNQAKRFGFEFGCCRIELPVLLQVLRDCSPQTYHVPIKTNSRNQINSVYSRRQSGKTIWI